MGRRRGNCAWLKTGVALALLAWGGGGALALELVAPLGVDEPVIPETNPLTPEKVALGQQIFFDPRLSADNTVSCASCHDPRKGFSNGERVGIGIRGQRGTRSVPTILNAALSDFYFWDGRAGSLEEQALGPIQSPGEMGQSHEATVAKLRRLRGYRAQFARAFGTETFTIREVAAAIATFERTLLTGNSPSLHRQALPQPGDRDREAGPRHRPGCSDEGEREAERGPALWDAGSKFRSAWLKAWLEKPTPIRQVRFGTLEKAVNPHPAVRGEEAAAIAAYLLTLRDPAVPAGFIPSGPPPGRRPSAPGPSGRPIRDRGPSPAAR